MRPAFCERDVLLVVVVMAAVVAAGCAMGSTMLSTITMTIRAYKRRFVLEELLLRCIKLSLVSF